MQPEIRLKQLYFRSSHRGSKETDLILGPYAEACLTQMNAEELDCFEAFLAEDDQDIWEWVVGKSEPDGEKYIRLIQALRARYVFS